MLKSGHKSSISPRPFMIALHLASPTDMMLPPSCFTWIPRSRVKELHFCSHQRSILDFDSETQQRAHNLPWSNNYFHKICSWQLIRSMSLPYNMGHNTKYTCSTTSFPHWSKLSPARLWFSRKQLVVDLSADFHTLTVISLETGLAPAPYHLPHLKLRLLLFYIACCTNLWASSKVQRCIYCFEPSHVFKFLFT